jgi:hypothetical protein
MASKKHLELTKKQAQDRYRRFTSLSNRTAPPPSCQKVGSFSRRRITPPSCQEEAFVTPHVTEILIKLLKLQLRHQASTNQVVEI